MARILIVDDAPRNRALLDVIVASDGHRTVHAGSGAEALAIAATDPPDLVLLDLMMPGIDGFQVLRQLRADARCRAIPVMVVSALDDVAARERILSAGADAFVGKPLDRGELLLRVNRLLARAPAVGADPLPDLGGSGG